MKLLITRRLTDGVIEIAAAHFDMTLRDDTRPMKREEAAQALRDHDAILPTLGDAFGADTFADVPEPRCKILANFGVGYNHIDVPAAKAKGIVVTNTPGAVTDATADIAMTLILMSARRAGEGERMVRAGKWQGWQPTQMLGIHVTGKTLGVIGMGRIGRAIAQRCHRGFDMRVVFFNRSRVALPGVPAQQMDSIAEVMAESDIIVVAVPGGAGTHHLIGAEQIAAMGPQSHIVNISRGDVIDEAALVAALQAGRIGGAGLDVYEHEPEVPMALRDLDNVTLLPHLGTAAYEVRQAMGMMALENLVAHAEGRCPPNLV